MPFAVIGFFVAFIVLIFVAFFKVGNFITRLFTEPVAVFWDFLAVVSGIFAVPIGMGFFISLLPFIYGDTTTLSERFVSAFALFAIISGPFIVLKILLDILLRRHAGKIYDKEMNIEHEYEAEVFAQGILRARDYMDRGQKAVVFDEDTHQSLSRQNTYLESDDDSPRKEIGQ